MRQPICDLSTGSMYPPCAAAGPASYDWLGRPRFLVDFATSGRLGEDVLRVLLHHTSDFEQRKARVHENHEYSAEDEPMLWGCE